MCQRSAHIYLHPVCTNASNIVSTHDTKKHMDNGPARRRPTSRKLQKSEQCWAFFFFFARSTLSVPERFGKNESPRSKPDGSATRLAPSSAVCTGTCLSLSCDKDAILRRWSYDDNDDKHHVRVPRANIDYQLSHAQSSHPSPRVVRKIIKRWSSFLKKDAEKARMKILLLQRYGQRAFLRVISLQQEWSLYRISSAQKEKGEKHTCGHGACTLPGKNET